MRARAARPDVDGLSSCRPETRARTHTASSCHAQDKDGVAAAAAFAEMAGATDGSVAQRLAGLYDK